MRGSRRLKFILIAVAVLFTIGTFINRFYSYRDTEAKTRYQLEQQLTAIASLKSSQLSLWHRERMANAEMLSKSAALPLLLEGRAHSPAGITGTAGLRDYLENFIEMYGFASCALTDARGSAIISLREHLYGEITAAHQAAIDEAFRIGEVVFVDFHHHEGVSADKIMLGFVAPVFTESPSREPLAAVILTIDPEDYLYPFISIWPIPSETAESILVKVEGEEVLYLSPLHFKPDAALSLRIPLHEKDVFSVKGSLGQEGIVEGLDYRGEKVIGALHKVAGTDWIMGTKMDYNEFIAPIDIVRNRQILITVLVLLLLYLLLFSVWRSRQLSYLNEVTIINEELEMRVVERTAQLESANNELEAFACSVSHDLRAPLRAMSGYSSLLHAEFSHLLGEAGQRYVERIQAASSRMGELIDDLLVLSRVTRSNFTYSQVDLGNMALELFTKLKETQPELKAEIKVEEGLAARGDRRLLTIALENLLNNAWKFSSQEPQIIIEVGAAAGGNRVKTFYIRDNGAGFNMDYASKLFIPFQRLRRTDEFPGTGIGASIVKRIVERHGGQIWAEAEVGKGATFYFSLPG